MNFHVINTTRSIQNRTHRALQPQHARLKQYVGTEQFRSVRGRPLVVSEAWVLANIEELRTKNSLGIIEVRTADGRAVDLASMKPAAPAAPVPAPQFPLDSAANDKNQGRSYSRFENGAPLSEAIAHIAEVQQAKAEMMAEDTASEEEEEVEFTEQAPQQPNQQGRRRNRGR